MFFFLQVTSGQAASMLQYDKRIKITVSLAIENKKVRSTTKNRYYFHPKGNLLLEMDVRTIFDAQNPLEIMTATQATKDFLSTLW